MITDLIVVDGIVYRPIGDAEIRQELLPGHRDASFYGSLLCVHAAETPDDLGTIALYELKYVLPDQEDYENGPEWWDNIDWESPDDIVKSQYRWIASDQRMV